MKQVITLFSALLDRFFARFELPSPPSKVFIPHSIPIKDDELFTLDDVFQCLSKLNSRKGSGPDNILPAVLKYNAYHLSPIIHKLFQNSINQRTVPDLWKSSLIKPLAKSNTPTSNPSDYRPIALTSSLVKTLEKLILRHIISNIDTDPLQFAYKAKRSSVDAVICLTDFIISHNNKAPGNYCRCLFMDFSSAFNTIHPNILTSTLLAKNINPIVVDWIQDFLHNRIQQTFVNATSISKSIHTFIGTPQGSVLSPVLFTTYIDHLRSPSPNIKFFKYADDIAIVGRISAENSIYDNKHYETVIEDLIVQCDQIALVLNTIKTKEMVFTVSTKPVFVEPLKVKSSEIEIVSVYRYLGINLTSNLNYDTHVQGTVKKAQS